MNRFASYILLLLSLVHLCNAFKLIRTIPRTTSNLIKVSASVIEVGNANEIPNGERKIIETVAGSVIVTNVDGW